MFRLVPAAAGSPARLLFGSLLGAVIVFAVAPHCIGWFSVPTGGVGTVTITRYPKGFDYFVIIALTVASAIGALALGRRPLGTTDDRHPAPRRPTATFIATSAVFVVMGLIHDHPYAPMDMFHEGENLAAASVMLDGGRLFRSAAGRCGVSHTRFAIPLLGIAVVAFLLEPWIRRRPLNLWRAIAVLIAAVVGFRYFEIAQNATLGAKLLAGWPARQRPDGLVPYPMPRGRGLYTSAENAANLAALYDLAQRAGSGRMFDTSGERALYYLLDRRPAVRCPDIAMLSAPALGAAALRELDDHPPRFVVLQRGDVSGSLGGVANRDRIPTIAAWIDAHYPVRVRAGGYLVGFHQ